MSKPVFSYGEEGDRIRAAFNEYILGPSLKKIGAGKTASFSLTVSVEDGKVTEIKTTSEESHAIPKLGKRRRG